jgi:hypothetical protein
MAELREYGGRFYDHAGRRYVVESNYSLSDSAWHLELSETRPAPAEWADIPNAVKFLPGRVFLVAAVPDEDPSREPYVAFDLLHEQPIPFEVMRWFMEKAVGEVEWVRAAMAANADAQE